MSAVSRILVVDDDPSMLDLLRLHLSNAGYGVEVAADALIAGRMLLKSPPQLLIVDIDMPFMNGIEFVSTLMSDSTLPDIKVLFISAHRQYAEQVGRMGLDFLHKPFHKELLLAAVRKNLADVN
jgi:DNA-binding response OmpR family regulator